MEKSKLTAVAYLLTCVVMFMIMFGFTLIATEVTEERNMILLIMFSGIALSVILAYPLVQMFEAFYADKIEGEKK